MGKRLCFSLALLAVFILAVPSHAAPKSEWEALVNEAQKEGKVVIYASPLGDTSGALTKAFKNKYGINLEFIMGRGGQLEKLQRERRAGLYLADVGIGGAEPFFITVQRANIAVPLEPLLMLEEVQDPTKWRTGKLSFLDERKTILALVAGLANYITINKGMVRDGEINSFDNLLEPKWKGKIVLNDPTLVGMSNQWFTFMMVIAYGREKGAEYMKKLSLQGPVISRDERLQVEWIAKGKYPLGLAFKRTEVTSFINAGAPIKLIPAREGGLISAGALHLYAFDKPAHPKAAKLFINWLLTKEAGEILARTSGLPSERVDVSKEGFDPLVVPGPKGALPGKEFFPNAHQMRKVAAEIFRDQLK